MERVPAFSASPQGRRQRGRFARLPAGGLPDRQGLEDLVDRALQLLEALVIGVLELLHLVRAR